ncbi:MAG: CRISPR-associated endoribonuclease Cas6 [Syntrophomonadaceae bacterium]
MRINIELDAEKELVLPIHYSHIVQGFLYKNLRDREYSEFLHQTGFTYGRKQFRLFTFSRLLAPFTLYRKQGVIAFRPPIHLIISSPLEPFITDLAETLITSDWSFLGSTVVGVKSISVEKEIAFQDRVQIKMLSPCVAYSTINIEGNRKRTEYYSPWQSRFQEIALSNLLAKYQILYGEPPGNDEFKIIPNGNQEHRFKAVINYKGTYIVGYNGIYWLQGNPELIKVAYDTGLGSKNSQGFGCWEVVG